MAFDPDNIQEKDMHRLADALEEYLENMQEVMVFPKDFDKENREGYRKGIEVTKELIHKLRKGKKSVFKDPDEFVILS